MSDAPTPEPDAAPELSPPPAPLHIASALAAVGQQGSALILGFMTGALALDAAAWLRGDGFTGQGLIAAALLGTMALLPGLACWVGGRRMMRERGDPPLCAPRLALIISLLAYFIGAITGWLLDLPVPPT
jgi:Ca2+/H+ antiporter